jgi:hypothetical protein
MVFLQIDSSFPKFWSKETLSPIEFRSHLLVTSNIFYNYKKEGEHGPYILCV